MWTILKRAKHKTTLVEAVWSLEGMFASMEQGLGSGCAEKSLWADSATLIMGGRGCAN